jgi:threonine/homoserine efflux transporter RhtA
VSRLSDTQIDAILVVRRYLKSLVVVLAVLGGFVLCCVGISWATDRHPVAFAIFIGVLIVAALTLAVAESGIP